MKYIPVRLSQCMIVKNEEKNIRRALSWAKKAAFEQIVVDTGSTDSTAEIAREMGAKVFHYTWTDDFAAAKNFAIEQAHGNWIAFLDADEYLSSQDTGKLMRILDSIQRNGNRKYPDLLRCGWMQLGDNGKVFAVSVQDRIFRNIPQVRYSGRIHEALCRTDGKPLSALRLENELSIMHTGYQSEAFQDTRKAERNIRLIKKELDENPNNYGMWSYLGDSLEAAGNYPEAKDSYRKALEGNPPEEISEERYRNAGNRLLRLLVYKPAPGEEESEIFETAKKLGWPDTDNPDVFMNLGIYYLQRGNDEKAYLNLKVAAEKVEIWKKHDMVFASGSLKNIYIWLTELCRRTGRAQETVSYPVSYTHLTLPTIRLV